MYFNGTPYGSTDPKSGSALKVCCKGYYKIRSELGVRTKSKVLTFSRKYFSLSFYISICLFVVKENIVLNNSFKDIIIAVIIARVIMVQMKRMSKDDTAISPVIGEMLMIVVVFILAAILAVYAYSVLDSATEISTATILIEGAEAGSSSITIVHMGGDIVPHAFTPSHSCFVNDSVFNVLEVRINGAVFEGFATLNSGAIAKSDFEVADELTLELGQPLSSGDHISVIYVPGGQIIREFDVW